MAPGDRVRRLATSEEGVVLAVTTGSLLRVAFPSGTVLIHAEELERLPEDPVQRLAAGGLGHAEPYGLRLQSLYLKHAYRYDPLTGLSSARIEPQLLHRIEEPPVHRLETIAGVGKRAAGDGRERVLQIALLERVAQRDLLDVAVAGGNQLLAHAQGLLPSPAMNKL